MNGHTVELHPEALEEAQAAVAWYEERSALAAERFASELDKAIESHFHRPTPLARLRGRHQAIPFAQIPIFGCVSGSERTNPSVGRCSLPAPPGILAPARFQRMS